MIEEFIRCPCGTIIKPGGLPEIVCADCDALWQLTTCGLYVGSYPVSRPRGRPIAKFCKRGHDLAANAVDAGNGKRTCRICRRMSWHAEQRARRAKKREPKEVAPADVTTLGFNDEVAGWG